MSDAQDGRARAIEAATLALLKSTPEEGEPEEAARAIDAALADGGVVTNEAYARACRRVSDLQHRCDRLWREKRDLRDRVDRAEEALHFYADPATYAEGAPPGELDGPVPIRLDKGARARAALEHTPDRCASPNGDCACTWR